MRTAYATFAAFRNDVNHIESGGSVPSFDAVLSWNVIDSCPPARYGSPTVSSVRSAAAGKGAPARWAGGGGGGGGAPGAALGKGGAGGARRFFARRAGAAP